MSSASLSETHTGQGKDLPFEIGCGARAVPDDGLWLIDYLTDVAVLIPDTTVIKRLPAKQTSLVTFLRRTPELKIVIIRIIDI